VLFLYREEEMKRKFRFVTAAFLLLVFVILLNLTPNHSSAEPEMLLMAATPVFRYPVVPGAVISGYFDHNTQAGQVTFYDGRRNLSPSYGFYFSCSNPSMYDFVGCQDAVSGEGACANNRELWYDGHKGIDYEYTANWHTGATCAPPQDITHPVYAPAGGKVMFAGYDDTNPANGWHIRIKHDLNGNGNYNDDNFRSNFLHFTAGTLAVQTNDIVSEGQYLGLGGTTGYSSSPHLHFEVQKSSDNFSTSKWSVDPYGWMGSGTDPWPYQNVRLWRINMPNRVFLPEERNIASGACPGCGDMLLNGGFESGKSSWVEVGVDIIDNRSYPNLPIAPYAGDWLAWLGGRNNAADRIYQDFRVPSGLGSARLRYAVYMSTAETGGVYDWLLVRLRSTSGTLMKELDGIDNTFIPKNQWVVREVVVPELSGYQGQDLRISFEGDTDGSSISSFYVDEISFEALPPN
jgi:murein DD-endopeptidase MepM/ murein hydrolase activator NlpD